VGIITQRYGWNASMIFLIAIGFITVFFRFLVWNAKAHGYEDEKVKQ
jgi:sugar phosphate permease